MFYRDTVGLTPDQGQPPEPTQTDHDLQALTQAAANVATAMDELGSTEIYDAYETLYPALDKIEERLHNMIQSIRNRQRDTALPAQYTRGRSKLFKT